MILESIVIIIVKKGYGSKPSYNLTIKGNGEVIFHGLENVNKIGITESLLESDKVISIMSSLKDSGFFSADKDTFIIDENSNRSFTSIKVEMPGENNVTKSKTISYYDDDSSVPLSLKNFEKKTIELTGIDKFIVKDMAKTFEEKKFDYVKKEAEIKKPVPSPPIKDTKKHFSNKKFLKIAVIAIFVVVILSVAYLGISSDIFNSKDSSDTSNGDIDNTIDNEKNPEISFITTTSSSDRINNERSKKKTVFYQGDVVYVDCEINNITKNSNYNFTVSIVVNLDFITYYSDSLNYAGATEDESLYFIPNFLTSDSWPTDDSYEIEINVNDKITNKNISRSTFFKLFEANETLIPSVSLEANVTSGFEPLNVYFTCYASNFSGNIASYEFDFGDSTVIKSSASISHIFDQVGLYSVTVTATDSNDMSESDSIYITVNEKIENSNLEASFTYYNTSKFDYIFTGSASNGVEPYTYEWDFDYDTSSFNNLKSGSPASWTYSSIGIYIVRLKVTDNDGNIDTYDKVIGVGF